jgi:hypothetical protein
MGVDMASVMDSLRSLALKKKAAVPEGNVPLFNSAFLKTVSMFGRAYDLAMIGMYKMGTMTFMKDTEKFPTMLMKKKIAILPVWISDMKRVKRIFREVDRNKGN